MWPGWPNLTCRLENVIAALYRDSKLVISASICREWRAVMCRRVNGLPQRGKAWRACFGKAWRACCGEAGCSVLWRGIARHGVARVAGRGICAYGLKNLAYTTGSRQATKQRNSEGMRRFWQRGIVMATVTYIDGVWKKVVKILIKIIVTTFDIRNGFFTCNNDDH